MYVGDVGQEDEVNIELYILPLKKLTIFYKPYTFHLTPYTFCLHLVGSCNTSIKSALATSILLAVLSIWVVKKL